METKQNSEKSDNSERADLPGNDAASSPKGNTHITVPIPDAHLGGNRAIRCAKKCITGSKDNLILILLLTAVIVGISMGFIIRNSRSGDFTKREIMYITFPGELLMRMLQMLILPLIVSSLIAGIASLDAKTCGRMGLRTIAYFATTTIMAVVLGIILTVTIQPGGGANRDEIPRYGKPKKVNSVDTFMDLIRNLFPSNLIVACYDSFRTSEKEEEKDMRTTPESTTSSVSFNMTEPTPVTTQMVYDIIRNMTGVSNDTVPEKPEMVPYPDHTGSTNVLGLVMFSIFMGVIIGRMEEKGKPILDFCSALAEATMKLFVIFIWYSPIGIAFLIAGKIVGMEDFQVLLGKVGLYFFTVICGLAIHGSVVLPALYFLCTRKNPYKFVLGILQALATAFGTSSSSATLPVTLHCLENNNGIDPRVSSFVIPVGATINMDGTALYEAVAALFIAQVNGFVMDLGKVITISITATAASIGAAGVPQAGLVTMVIVLSAVGLPTEDMTLILVVDWFLDRFRTMTNVLGDSLGAGIVHHLSQGELAPLHQDGGQARHSFSESHHSMKHHPHNDGSSNPAHV